MNGHLIDHFSKMEGKIEMELSKNYDYDNVIDINQTCRICASVNEYLIPIYDGEGVEHCLASKINQYLPISVTETDELSRQLCYQCASLLITWHEMFIGSLKAEEELRKLKMRLESEEKFQVDECSKYSTGDSENVISGETDQTRCKSDSDFETNEYVSDVPTIGLGPYCGDSFESEKFLCSIKMEPSSNFSPHQKIVHITQSNEVSKPLLVWKSIYDQEVDAKLGSDSSAEACYIETESKDPLEILLKQQTIKKKSFQCRLCPRKNYHKHAPNGQLLKEYECEECHKFFASKSEFSTHAQTHSKEKLFMCDLCGKRFKVKNSLSNHIKYTHIGLRKFTCPFCGWTACRRYNLDVHIRRHTGLKPFVCSVCGRSFSQKNDMLKHENRHHTDERKSKVRKSSRD